MAWKVNLIWDNGDVVTGDEEFSTKKAAFNYGMELYNDYRVGSQELFLRDPDENPYDPDDMPEIDVFKE